MHSIGPRNAALRRRLTMSAATTTTHQLRVAGHSLNNAFEEVDRSEDLVEDEQAVERETRAQTRSRPRRHSNNFAEIARQRQRRGLDHSDADTRLSTAVAFNFFFDFFSQARRAGPSSIFLRRVPASGRDRPSPQRIR